MTAKTRIDETESDFGVPIRRAVEPLEEKEVLSTPSISEKKSSKRTSDVEEKETPPPAKDTIKVKKSKSKKKKSGNAIDDIFGALK